MLHVNLPSRIVLLVLLASHADLGKTAGPSVDIDAGSLMSRVATTYESLSAYSDEGRSVQTLWPNGSAPTHWSEVKFSTYFKRPANFAFCWSTKLSDAKKSQTPAWQNRIWSDQGKVLEQYLFDRKKPRIAENFGMAVAAATGVSHGAALEIYSLITTDVVGFKFSDLSGLKIVGSEELSGVGSHILRGTRKSGAIVDLWIGKQDFLIRKGIEHQADGNTETFERLNIRINDAVDDARSCVSR